MSWLSEYRGYYQAARNFSTIIIKEVANHHRILNHIHHPFLHLPSQQQVAVPSPTVLAPLLISHRQTHGFTVEFIVIDVRLAWMHLATNEAQFLVHNYSAYFHADYLDSPSRWAGLGWLHLLLLDSYLMIDHYSTKSANKNSLSNCNQNSYQN